MHPVNINNRRDNDKNLEQLNGGCPIEYIFGCLLLVLEKRFLRWICMKIENNCTYPQSRSNAYVGGVRK